MFTLKDKYILGYISTIWVYLLFRTYHTASYYGNYGYILLSIIILGGWFIGCNYRMFTMTRGKLCNHYYESKLSYKPYIKKNVVENIYVSINNSDEWYELDYILTIPKNCSLSDYNVFVNKHDTVNKLLRTMNSKADSDLIGEQYRLLKTEYNTTRWILLFTIIMCYFIYSLIYAKYFFL